MEQARREPRHRPSPPHYAALVRAWRWQVAGASEPIPLTWVLPVADAVYATLTEVSRTLRGSRRLPVCLHGPDEPKQIGWRHGHAFFLPEDADGDGLIEHISVYAPMGLDPSAVRLLAAIDRLVLSNGAAMELTLERAGDLDAVGHAGPARTWLSRTPYVPPNARRFSLKDAAKQLKSEIGKRGLAAPLARDPVPVPTIADRCGALQAEEFHLEPDNAHLPPRGSEPCFFGLEFEEPIAGPLAFGWQCHRGLGQFGAEGEA